MCAATAAAPANAAAAWRTVLPVVVVVVCCTCAGSPIRASLPHSGTSCLVLLVSYLVGGTLPQSGLHWFYVKRV